MWKSRLQSLLEKCEDEEERRDLERMIREKEEERRDLERMIREKEEEIERLKQELETTATDDDNDRDGEKGSVNLDST